MDRLLDKIGSNPEVVKRMAARCRLSNFARYMQPSLQMLPYHKVYYELLDRFAKGRIKKLMVQMPPQHGKSQGSSRFLPAFILGLNPDKKIAIGSYTATFAEKFNRDVQRIIDTPEYGRVFPDTKINGRNVVTTQSWLRNSTEFEVVGRKGSLRTVGRGGPLTGITVDVAILDDVYKDYAEGNSPTIREAAWNWYTSVISTRLHNDSQQLIVFTRWHEDDLIGRIEKGGEQGGEQIVDVYTWEDIDKAEQTPDVWVRINFEALKTSDPYELDPRQPGESLWESRHSREMLLARQSLAPMQFQCLYQGHPGSAVGRLYHPFRTWVNKEDFGKYIRTGAYVDVADEGNDFLFAVTYDVYKSDSTIWNEQTRRHEPILYALVTDMEFTDAPTEVTTVTVPALINRNGVQVAWVESNNGGSIFSKIIEPKVQARVIPFYQGGNKESRIITASANVNTQIIMPFGWEQRYRAVWEHLTTFIRHFRANKHDDAEDGLTGVYEKELAEGNAQPYSARARGVVRRN